MEGGNIDLKRSVVEYLPEFEGILDPRITTHHLLLHISGLPYIKRKMYKQFVAPAEIVKQSLNNKSQADFGSFNYNDLDYVILGLLIEKCTGRSWKEEVQKHILDELNMESTGFLEYGYYPDDFAYCYSYKKGGKKVQDPFFYIENLYAAGNMYSTSTDLLKLDQALYTDLLLSASSRTLLEKSNPELFYAGYGVWNYSYPFVETKPRIMERRGGLMGANVVMLRILSSRATIIVLSNDDRFNPDSFGDPENLRESLIRTMH
jgi:CubicO group peptidase (beta-lactamase class C family)